MTQDTLWTPEVAPYVRPMMAEVREVPWNGLTAVGSFSGCGGSSLGLRMAGFRVPYAIEFIATAARTYEANSDAYVDRRDVREIKGAEILERLGMDRGQLDLFEGSPPCASFSSAGTGKHTREQPCPPCKGRGYVITIEGQGECESCLGLGRIGGTAKTYGAYGFTEPGDAVQQRTDDLFWEWARLLGDLYPRAFIAENVPGMLRAGALEDYAQRITRDLGRLGYRVTARVLNAASYGTPQSRRRLVFVGLREDLFAGPFDYPPPTVETPFTLGQALEAVAPDDPDHAPFVAEASMEGLAVGRSWHMIQERRARGEDEDALATHCDRCGETLAEHEVTRWKNGQMVKARCADGVAAVITKAYFSLAVPRLDRPCPTLTAAGALRGAASVTHPTECRKLTPAEAKAICGFPADFVLTGDRFQRYERMGRAVPPPLYAAVGRRLAEVLGGR